MTAKPIDQQLADAADRLVEDLLAAQRSDGGYHPHQLPDLVARAERTVEAAFRLGRLSLKAELFGAGTRVL